MKKYLSFTFALMFSIFAIYKATAADTAWLSEYLADGIEVIGVESSELKENSDKYMGTLVYTVVEVWSDPSSNILMSLTMDSDNWISDIDASFDKSTDIDGLEKDDIVAILGTVEESGLFDFGAIQLDECHVVAVGADAERIQSNLLSGITHLTIAEDAGITKDEDQASPKAVISDSQPTAIVDWLTQYHENGIDVLPVISHELKNNRDDYTDCIIYTVLKVYRVSGSELKARSEGSSIYDVVASFDDKVEISVLHENDKVAIIGQVEPGSFFDFGDVTLSDCHIVAYGDHVAQIESEIASSAEQVLEELDAKERQEREEREVKEQQEHEVAEKELAEQRTLEMKEYNYDVAYRVGFDGLARYYLLDTATRTITSFTSYLNMGKETGTYTGDLKNGIDYSLDGSQFHAETMHDGSILTVTSKSGLTYKGYVSDVELIKGYWLSPETFEDENITVNNNQEFATLLESDNPSGSYVEKFAAKFAGRIIEFDGNIAYMSKHGNYSTRFDFLLYPGDYSETSLRGPNFKYEDCNYNDLHLTGDSIPDSISIGDSFHFVAKIEEYNADSELFFLEPVSTEAR